MPKFCTLTVNLPVNWGVLPIGTKVEIIDDHTVLNESYRCKVIGSIDQIFGIGKGALSGVATLED
jgi:hypothetical protein